jgi:NAD(P)-dependent dehydrogenase (short-subunit alcohol dehydrogenase family)
MPTALLFGASGTLGTACRERLIEEKWEVRTVAHTETVSKDLPKLNAIVWAQGLNFSASVEETSIDSWNRVIAATVTFVFRTLQEVLAQGVLENGSRLVVLSSVWEQLARANKTAYITSKSALGGLIRSLSVDLAPLGISINSVLPGVIDSPMTRQHLSSQTIESIKRETPGGRLVSAQEVSDAIFYLISKNSTGITGQSIIVDNGWSIFKNV